MLHRDGATHQWQPIRDHNPHKVTFPFPAASIHQLPPAPWLRVGCWGPLCCPCWVFNWLDLMQVNTVALRACVWRGLSEDNVPQHSSPLSGFYILLTLPYLMLLSLGMGGQFHSPVTTGHSPCLFPAFSWSWVSPWPATHCNMKSCWPRWRAVQIYGLNVNIWKAVWTLFVDFDILRKIFSQNS